jgi:glycosyltransferase involved in cell wall biosynthesis
LQALGFVNAFDELSQPDQRIGRKVANYGLVSALLEHSSVDELHFYLPFQKAVKPFEKGYGPWLQKAPNPERVRLLPALKMPVALTRVDYLAMHAAELDRYFPELCHLRNRWAVKPFPVTCTTHSLSYWSTQVRNLYKLLPGPLPFDAVFCTSRAAQKHLQAAFTAAAAQLRGLGMQGAGYAGRLEILPLGVRAADFQNHSPSQALQNLDLKPGPLNLLCLGRLRPSDKYDLLPLLAVVGQLCGRFDLRLILAGGESRLYGQDLLKAGAELGLGGKVKLFADFDSRIKPDLYAAADVFISPADNLQETFGLTILEAMAAGLPVVASDFSGYRDLVIEDETGFLIPTLGPADTGLIDAGWPIMTEFTSALQMSQRTALDLGFLRARLETLLSDAELRRKMGDAGQRRIAERFDWPVVIKAMETKWQELKAAAPPQAITPRPPNVAGAGLASLFGHFTTRLISPSDRLAPGPFAEAFTQGSWARQPFTDLGDLLPPAGLEMILEGLQKLGGQAELAQLQNLLGPSLPPQMCEHLVLHGLKYGVLALRT